MNSLNPHSLLCFIFLSDGGIFRDGAFSTFQGSSLVLLIILLFPKGHFQYFLLRFCLAVFSEHFLVFQRDHDQYFESHYDFYDYYYT